MPVILFRWTMPKAANLLLPAVALAASIGMSSLANAQGMGASGQMISGISCDAQEGQRVHIHQHLVILDHGKPVPIPADVGRPSNNQCLYWLHTHTPDGIVHIEAPLTRSFTLGDFFAIWGKPLTKTRAATASAAKGSTLKVWVNGKPFAGDPNKIELLAHTDIVIMAGPPFTKPPAFTNWGTL
jgi:hypothetical protein